MMSPDRIFENRGATATLLELSERGRNRKKNPPTKQRRRALICIYLRGLEASVGLSRIRNFVANTYMYRMDKTPLPELDAKLERKRLAAEEGAKALQEIAERATAVRENMARLRALRLAREAKAIATANPPKAKSNKRSR